MIREIRALLRDRSSQSDQQGFTLIEMSIVLAIIGLIVGGILKGQEVVNNARLKTQVAQIDAVKSAVFTFQDQYAYLPGDYPYASTNLGLTSGNGDGNGIIATTGTTSLDDKADATSTESVLAWADLATANLLSGIQLLNGTTMTSVTSASNISYAGKMSNTYLWLGTFTVSPPGGAPSSTAVMTRLQGVLSGALTTSSQQALREADASNLDRKYDDGNPSTGSILAGSESTGNCAIINAYTLGTNASANNNYCTLFWVVE